MTRPPACPGRPLGPAHQREVQPLAASAALDPAAGFGRSCGSSIPVRPSSAGLGRPSGRRAEPFVATCLGQAGLTALLGFVQLIAAIQPATARLKSGFVNGLLTELVWRQEELTARVVEW